METIHAYNQGQTSEYIFNSPHLKALRDISAYDENNDENNTIDVPSEYIFTNFMKVTSYTDLYNCLRGFHYFHIETPPNEFIINLQNFMSNNERRIGCGLIINTYRKYDFPSIKNLSVEIQNWREENFNIGTHGYYIKKTSETSVNGHGWPFNYYGTISDIKYLGQWQKQKRCGYGDGGRAWEIFTLKNLTTEHEYAYEGYSFFCAITDREIIEILGKM